MKKIPTVFRRDPDDMAHVTTEANPECQWVLDGEGVPTRKYDGTCVMLAGDGNWWARREVKPGKTPPTNWVEADHDETTGKRVGWEPSGQAPFAKFMGEALNHWDVLTAWKPGTYELCGPKVNGNPEGYDLHVLVPHAHAAKVILPDGFFYSWDTLRIVCLGLGDQGVEGIVWHHRDGRMAKLKARDFTTTPPTVATEGDGGEGR